MNRTLKETASANFHPTTRMPNSTHLHGFLMAYNFMNGSRP